MWILALSIALKLSLALTLHPSPVGDEKEYLFIARALSQEGGYVTSFRPPLHPAYLAAIFFAGGDLTAVRICQVLLSSLSVLLVYRIARRAFDLPTAVAACGIVAFDPVLLGFSHTLWSEPLFLFFLLAGTDFALAAGSRRWAWLASGLCIGLAGLVRAQILTLLPFVLAWVVWQAGKWGPRDKTARRRVSRAALASAAYVVIGVGLVIAPWTLRNAWRTGALVVVDTNGAYNIALGTHPRAMYVDKDDAWTTSWAPPGYRELVDRDPNAAQSNALGIAWRRIRTSPLRFLRKSVWEAGHLWTLDSFLLRHLRNEWYGPSVPGWVTPITAVVAAMFSAALLSGGLIALVVLPASRFRSFARLTIVHATVLFGLTFSLSRYAAPLRPFLAVAAAALAVSLWRGRPSVEITRGRAAVIVLILGALLCVWGRDVPLLRSMVADDAEQFRFRSRTTSES